MTSTIFLQWAVAISFAFIAAGFIYALFRYNGRICEMVCEPNGKGSASRLQMLFFTLLIGGAYVARFLDKGDTELNTTALALLGISSGSYLVSKGISAGTDLGRSPSEKSVGIAQDSNVVFRDPNAPVRP